MIITRCFKLDKLIKKFEKSKEMIDYLNKINKDYINIINYLKENNYVTLKKIQDLCGVGYTQASVRAHILVDSGNIEKIENSKKHKFVLRNEELPEASSNGN